MAAFLTSEGSSCCSNVSLQLLLLPGTGNLYNYSFGQRFVVNWGHACISVLDV